MLQARIIAGAARTSNAVTEQPGTPKDILVFEGLQSLIEKVGLECAAKRFSSSQWEYFLKRYFLPVSQNAFVNVRQRLAKSTRDWLEDIIRFPRTKYARALQMSKL